MATAFRQFHLTRSAGNTRQNLDNLEGSSWYKEEKRRDRQRQRVGEKKNPAVLERLNEVEMCPPQGFPGNYICSANRGGVRGGFEQGEAESMYKEPRGR